MSKAKILWVDDQIDLLKSHIIFLNEKGYQIDSCTNGSDALDKISNNRFDVILLDENMPGISGIEATKIIRTFDKELTIFALTAVTLEDKMHEFDEAGFDDIISKPFKQEDFEKKLYSALEKTQKPTAI